MFLVYIDTDYRQCSDNDYLLIYYVVRFSTSEPMITWIFLYVIISSIKIDTLRVYRNSYMLSNGFEYSYISVG